MVSEAEWAEYVGLGGSIILDRIRRRHGLTETTAELVAEKDRAFLRRAPGIVGVFPPIRELVLALRLRDIPLAVATSTQRHVLDVMLVQTGLSRAISATVSVDDVQRPKPDPESYIEAARRLDVPPRECWVVEDSQYGVQAAVSAGMRVVAVPARGHESMEAFGLADVVVTGGAQALDPAAVISAFGLDLDPDKPDASPALPTVGLFRSTVRAHLKKPDATMPWRLTTKPYEILVSEFMLQQTQSSRVPPKYRDFLDRFPTVDLLAAADLRDVLQIWQGLGYNRRARYLRDTARMIRNQFGGSVPKRVEELRTLPGIGAYTAGAIRAFAFNLPAVFIETNIRRVFIQAFFPGRDSVHDREILELIGITLDTSEPRQWYYALMDYGAHLASVFGNANRFSAHYSRQGRFTGSVREMRGAIIRSLTTHGRMTMTDVRRTVNGDDPRFTPAVDGLVRDGLICIRDDTVELG